MKLLSTILIISSIFAYSQQEQPFVSKTKELFLLLKERAGTVAVNSGDELIINVSIKDYNLPVKVTKKNGQPVYACIVPGLTFYSNVNDSDIADYVLKELFYLLLLNDKTLKEYTEGNRLLLSLNDNSLNSAGFFDPAEIIPVLTDTTAKVDYIFNYSDDEPVKNRHVVTWTSSNGTFSFSFPARVDLILDKDKRELDSLFFNYLLQVKSGASGNTAKPSPVINAGSIIRDEDTGLFIALRDRMWGYSSDLFFTRDDNRMASVFSKDYFRETIMNYVQGQTPGAPDLLLNLEHKQYSGGKDVNGVNLHLLVTEMSGNHLVLTATDEGNDSLITTVIFYNRSLGYIHLLYFTFPFDKIINRQTTEAKAKIYSYIRLDNVKSYFEEYRDKEKRFKVKTK